MNTESSFLSELFMSLEEWVRSPSQRSGSRARCKHLEPDDDDDNDDDDDVDDDEDDDGDDDDVEDHDPERRNQLFSRTRHGPNMHNADYQFSMN